MKISFLFIIILLVILFFAVRGHRVGLVGVLFGAISWVFTIILIILAGPVLANALTDNTGIADAIHSYFLSFRPTGIGSDIVKSLSESLTYSIMRLLGALLAFFIALFVTNLIRYILRDILNEKGLIGKASRITGTLWGIFEGLVIGWVILGFCGIILNGVTKGELYSDIQDNALLAIMYNYNPIASFFF